MSRKIFIIFIAVLLFFFVINAYALVRSKIKQGQISEAKRSSNFGTITINQTTLNVEIADTQERHQQGLSGKDKISDSYGMLFVFEKPLIPQFWMKDMFFPLDMIWINKEFLVVGITKNIPTSSFPKTFEPSSPIIYVLEVNAGWADRNNIAVGDLVRF